MYNPTRQPAAWRQLAIQAAVLPLPLVPAMCGDVDEAELPFRVAQGAQESAGTAQTGLAALPFDGVDIGQCFGVTHKTIPSFLGLLRPQSQATEDAAAAEEKEHQGIQHSDDAVQGHADGQQRG